MGQVRRSPLLLCACCIIAVRHTSQDYATRLAPMLFDEAKHLLSVSMLTAPQPMEFFQAALVLSLWSTTIGQVPLSVDGWLLSGFALQHSQASIVFGQGSSGSARKDQHLKLTVWNHLCLAHLQYVLKCNKIYGNLLIPAGTASELAERRCLQWKISSDAVQLPKFVVPITSNCAWWRRLISTGSSTILLPPAL